MSKRYDFTEVVFHSPTIHDEGDSDVLYKGSRLGAWWYWFTLPNFAKAQSTRVRVRAVSL